MMIRAGSIVQMPLLSINLPNWKSVEKGYPLVFFIFKRMSTKKKKIRVKTKKKIFHFTADANRFATN